MTDTPTWHPEWIERLATIAALLDQLKADMVRDDAIRLPPETDALLTRAQAAARLQVSEQWLARRQHRLPFTVRLSPHRFRFSRNGIDHWLARLPARA